MKTHFAKDGSKSVYQESILLIQTRLMIQFNELIIFMTWFIGL